jgi:hypothetical protein
LIKRTEELRQQEHDTNDPHSSKQSHSERASIFVSWLIDKFGKVYLSSGSGILDVAGGRGAVSRLFTLESILTVARFHLSCSPKMEFRAH